MKIAVIASEVAPYSKTGGLGDVLGALPNCLSRDAEVLVLSTLYRPVRRRPLVPLPQTVEVPIRSATIPANFQASASDTPSLRHVFVEHDPYYDRDGLYGTAEGDYADNCERFVFF